MIHLFNGQYWYFPPANDIDHQAFKSNGKDSSGLLFADAVSSSQNGRTLKQSTPANSRKKNAKQASSLWC